MDVRPNRYTQKTLRQLRIFYTLAIAIWTLVCFQLGMFYHGFLGILIVMLPVFIAVVALVMLPTMNPNLESEIYKANFLSLGLIVAISLFVLLEKNYLGERRTFAIIVLLAVVCSLLSLVYFWVSPTYLSLTMHAKSFFQTASATLLMYAIFLYFTYTEKTGLS